MSSEEAIPEIVNFGRAGEIVEVNPDVVNALDREKFIPVIAPVGAGEDGGTYNINADKVAGHLAAALQAEKLILLTDVKGVLDGGGELLSSINENEAKRLIDSGQVFGGMVPKLQCCLDALAGGVTKSHIVDGRVEHAVLLEIFTDAGVGTEIKH